MRDLLIILKSFDLPDYRKTKTTHQNFEWLYKNLKVKNENHPKYNEAMEKIKNQLLLMNVKV